MFPQRCVHCSKEENTKETQRQEVFAFTNNDEAPQSSEDPDKRLFCSVLIQQKPAALLHCLRMNLLLWSRYNATPEFLLLFSHLSEKKLNHIFATKTLWRSGQSSSGASEGCVLALGCLMSEL